MCMCGGVVELGLLMGLLAFVRKTWRVFFLLAVVVNVAACPPLNAEAVKACKEACAPHNVAAVDGNQCQCRQF